jgi:hypothetical protein
MHTSASLGVYRTSFAPNPANTFLISLCLCLCVACSKSFDLGQFERFRRIMHIPAYKPLLNHEEVQTLSTLQVRVAACMNHNAPRLIMQETYPTDQQWLACLSSPTEP